MMNERPKAPPSYASRRAHIGWEDALTRWVDKIRWETDTEDNGFVAVSSQEVEEDEVFWDQDYIGYSDEDIEWSLRNAQ